MIRDDQDRRRGSHTGAAPDRFSSTAMLAERFDISEKTIRRWIKAGELVAHRLGAQLRVAESDVELFLRQRRGLR